MNKVYLVFKTDKANYKEHLISAHAELENAKISTGNDGREWRHVEISGRQVWTFEDKHVWYFITEYPVE